VDPAGYNLIEPISAAFATASPAAFVTYSTERSCA
jgi:hypothetical protein